MMSSNKKQKSTNPLTKKQCLPFSPLVNQRRCVGPPVSLSPTFVSSITTWSFLPSTAEVAAYVGKVVSDILSDLVSLEFRK